MHTYAQTNIQLFNQLQREGYGAADLEAVARAYDLAIALTTGRFRASGKTFIAHLVGTAGILGSLKAPGPLVVAGLLHAAYAAGDFGDDQSGDFGGQARTSPGRDRRGGGGIRPPLRVSRVVGSDDRFRLRGARAHEAGRSRRRAHAPRQRARGIPRSGNSLLRRAATLGDLRRPPLPDHDGNGGRDSAIRDSPRSSRESSRSPARPRSKRISSRASVETRLSSSRRAPTSG